MTEKRLIVGLGNPGLKYETTRHNIGFQVVDELVARHRLGAGRGDQRALNWDGLIQGIRVKLAKPQTFMNRSGESVGPLLSYYDIPLEKLLVIHDDLDTPFGSLRLRKSGGHGGQNGLRSIIQHLGSREFARLRFGIGRPPGKMSPVDYVLQPFKGDDAILARELVSRAADAVELWLSAGIETAMSQFNGAAATAEANAQPKPDLEAQLRICLRAHELSPSDPKPLRKLIALQKKRGAIDEAVANHLKLAELYARLDQPRLANAERVKAVSISPHLTELQREIAEWYLANQNAKKAVGRYLILAEHFRNNSEISAAIETVERALAINPQHPKALDMRRALGEFITAGLGATSQQEVREE